MVADAVPYAFNKEGQRALWYSEAEEGRTYGGFLVLGGAEKKALKLR